MRQAIALLENNYDRIKNQCNETVITATASNSPQGAIIAKTAKEFGLKAIIGVGGCKEHTLYSHYLLQLAKYYGADIRIIAGHAQGKVVESKARQIALKENYFHIAFGINLNDDAEAIISSTANQVQNLPDNLDNLVITVGSGIIMGGILGGIAKYNKKVKRIIGVQVVHHDRRPTIDKCYKSVVPFGVRVPYEFYYTGIPYDDVVLAHFGDNIPLDVTYEAKVFNWMMKNVDVKTEKTLFWIVGKKLTEEQVNYLIKNKE